MKPQIPAIQIEANAPLAHIFLSLDLLELSGLSPDNHSYLKIIRQNTERLQSLIKKYSMDGIKV